ncbi:MAG: hypothetical protein WBE11_13405 [Candidatus Aminicenantaceae bacterium]
MRTAPTSERSFLAGETESVFDIIQSDHSGRTKTDLETLALAVLYLTSMSDCSKMMDNNRSLFIFSDKSYESIEEVVDDE